MRTLRKELIGDKENMDEAMCRLANRQDIWQDRMLWHICKAIADLLVFAIRTIDRGGNR